MTTTITIVNQKGGVGKTTTAVHLAAGLAMAGPDVLLVDLDPQGQCATFLGQPQAPGIYDLLIKEIAAARLTISVDRLLHLLQSDYSTSLANALLPTLNRPINDLKRRLPQNSYDYIIIDTAPSVSSLQAQAIFAADYILIPTACDFASTQGIIMLEETIQSIKHSYQWPGKLLGILPTFFDEVTRETQTVIKELSTLYPKSLLQPIRRATVLRECAAAGQTIYTFQPGHRADDEYRRLVEQVKELTR